MQSGKSAFNRVVRWRELGEVENECTSHNVSLFAIFLSKIIKIDANLTKFWQKQFCTIFWDTMYTLIIGFWNIFLLQNLSITL